jgi:hypothetical protein
MTLENAKTEPTERSTSPAVISTACPITTIPTCAVRLSTPGRLPNQAPRVPIAKRSTTSRPIGLAVTINAVR